MKDKVEKTSFLITGGAGFIGSNLVEALVRYNAKSIVILDDLSTGFKENIVEFLELDSVTFIQGSILDYELCKKASKGVDVVFHLAALGSVPRSIDNPLATNLVNSQGFFNVIDAARLNEVQQFVYSSSSSVYGTDATIPKLEERIGEPLSPYAVTKRYNELVAQNFRRTYGMHVIGLRYFNVFGPKQNINGPYAAVIPIFIDNFLKNKSCVINGDGTISRDFTYVSNVVEANVLAAFYDCGSSKEDLFNIAVGESISLNKLFDAIAMNLGSENRPVYGPKRAGDIQSSLASIDKAKTLLGYFPGVKFEEGLQKTVDWYKSLKI